MSELTSIKIGKYTLRPTRLIARDQSGIWITVTEDGEGGVFNEDALERLLDYFYAEHF